MIDLLLYIALAAALLIYVAGKREPAAASGVAAVVSAFAMIACIASLYLHEARFAYVVWPSAAADAGVRGPGRIVRAGESPIGNIGQLLAIAAPGSLALASGAEVRIDRAVAGDWQFWRALDSYSLEEMMGGLVLFPRRPVYRQRLGAISGQAPGPFGAGTRIVSAMGTATATIPDLLAVLEPIPSNGVAPLRVMNSTPDQGEETIYYAPSGLPMPAPPAALAPVELAQVQLELSGLPLLMLSRSNPVSFRTLFRMPNALTGGPDGLSAALADGRILRQNLFPSDQSAYPRPRLALLPRFYANPFVTVLAAIPGVYVRQLLQLVQLPTLASLAPYLPAQYYLLDDPLSLPSLLFRVASLAASLAIAFGAWACLRRKSFLPQFIARRPATCVFLATLLLQLADLVCLREL